MGRYKEVLLIAVIFMQSLAIVVLFEKFSVHPDGDGHGDENVALSKNRFIEGAADGKPDAKAKEQRTEATATTASRPHVSDANKLPHSTPNPGGLVLSASFSYMPDPRLTNRKKPLPWILPAYESIYHFDATVRHYGLHAIILHDDASFNATFVDRHASENLKFVRVESPTFGPGDVLSPNDYRYVAFGEWLKSNSRTRANGETGEDEVLVNGIRYDWIMIADLDVYFQRNPFPKLDEYASERNLTFFGSYDGGTWESEQVRLQRKLFRNCYGRELLMSWKDDVEWKTRNGNCGLWAGRHREVSCVLECMTEQYSKPPVKGKGERTICDMATHDYCVHYGGCFPGSAKGVYDRNKVGALWGEPTQGQYRDLFGPPYGFYRQCDSYSWTVVHDRCNFHGATCFRKNEKDELVKYHQVNNTANRKCSLNQTTYLPVDYYDEQ